MEEITWKSEIFYNNVFKHGLSLLLGKQFIKKVLSFLFLIEVVLSHLLHESLHAVGVLFHPVEQTLQHQGHSLHTASKT